MAKTSSFKNKNFAKVNREKRLKTNAQKHHEKTKKNIQKRRITPTPTVKTLLDELLSTKKTLKKRSIPKKKMNSLGDLQQKASQRRKFISKSSSSKKSKMSLNSDIISASSLKSLLKPVTLQVSNIMKNPKVKNMIDTIYEKNKGKKKSSDSNSSF